MLVFFREDSRLILSFAINFLHDFFSVNTAYSLFRPRYHTIHSYLWQFRTMTIKDITNPLFLWWRWRKQVDLYSVQRWEIILIRLTVDETTHLYEMVGRWALKILLKRDKQWLLCRMNFRTPLLRLRITYKKDSNS